MPAPSRLELVDRTLEYLERGDVESAKKYLEWAREEILKERERKRIRRSSGSDDPCIRRLMSDVEFQRKAREIIEKAPLT